MNSELDPPVCRPQCSDGSDDGRFESDRISCVQSSCPSCGLSHPHLNQSCSNAYLSALTLAIGCCRLALGTIGILSQLTATVIQAVVNTGGTLHVVAAGIWSGTFFAIGGLFGIHCSREPTINKLIVNLILSAIGLVSFGPGMLALSVMGFIDTRLTDTSLCQHGCKSHEKYNCPSEDMCQFNTVVFALSGALVTSSVLLILTEIVNATLVSKALCAIKRNPPRYSTVAASFIRLPHLPPYSFDDPMRESYLDISGFHTDRDDRPPPYDLHVEVTAHPVSEVGQSVTFGDA